MSDQKLSKKQKKAKTFFGKKQTLAQSVDDEERAFPKPEHAEGEKEPTVNGEAKQKKQKKSKDVKKDEDKTAVAAKSETGTKKNKKRKQDSEGADSEVKAEEKKPNKKRKTDSKKKGEDGEEPDAANDEPKRRFIIFVGNLPYTATKSELAKHFTPAGRVISCRFMTDKQTGKPKGFAFLEFEDSQSLSNALHFHHTLFLKRQINVELTAGGGGNKSEARKAKIDKKRTNLEEERRKYFEKEVAPNKSAKSDKPAPEVKAKTENAGTAGDKPRRKNQKAPEQKFKRPPRMEGANAISIDGANRRMLKTFD